MPNTAVSCVGVEAALEKASDGQHHQASEGAISANQRVALKHSCLPWEGGGRRILKVIHLPALLGPRGV